MREWKFIDKSRWPMGPWMDEPDKIQWIDEATGLTCLIRRSEWWGGLWGYVGVPKEHPWFGRGHSEYRREGDNFSAPAALVEVYGGLQYSIPCDTRDPEHGVCHIPEPGEADGLFWFGFYCADYLDYAPNIDDYKDAAFVCNECMKLARQLKAVGDGY